MVISLIGAVLIAWVLWSIGAEYGSGSIYLKQRYAKQFAFEIDSLSSITGDAYIINDNPYGFSYEFKDNKVTAFKKESDIVRLALRVPYEYFPANDKYKIDLRLSDPKQVVISKINGEVHVTEQIPEAFRVSSEIGRKIKESAVLIDISTGDDRLFQIAKTITLSSALNKDFPNMKISYEGQSISSSDIAICLRTKESEKASVYFYQVSESHVESLRLASLMAQKLSSANISSEFVPLQAIDSEKNSCLNNNKAAVYIEVPKTAKMLAIAEAVYNSLEEYSR